MAPDAERRPAGSKGAGLEAHGGGFSYSIGRRGCLWLLAAARTGDHRVIEAVIRLHPAGSCPRRPA
jgi:hypothetical protein